MCQPLLLRLLKKASGPVFPEVEEFYPQATSGYIDRTTMNTWEDENAYKAITGTGKAKLVLAGCGQAFVL
jgi:hypothetical protein